MESVHGVAQVFMTDKKCQDTQQQCHCAEDKICGEIIWAFSEHLQNTDQSIALEDETVKHVNIDVYLEHFI